MTRKELESVVIPYRVQKAATHTLHMAQRDGNIDIIMDNME
jgi:hypothetical protein